MVIGRNEGENLSRCLKSLKGHASPIVYVDSGSGDGSVALARRLGADVIELDPSRPFSAARARNEGLGWVEASVPYAEFVQVIDGDCEMAPDWIRNALAAMERNQRLSVVCGRRRERHPGASIWNRLADEEWNTPVGPAFACGGDALLRRAAIAEVGGYRDSLIAGEEPEMCFRLRQAGWRIERLDAEMTLHDIAMTRFSQWWRRVRRGGHAFAEGAALHGRSPERFCVREVRRALVWGFGVPLLAVLGCLITPWALTILLAWPAQVLRLRLRGEPWRRAVFLTVAKMPEAIGVAEYWWGRVRGRGRGLVEYK